MPGKFITIEGLDGSGLSTQAVMLNEYLNKQGIQTVLTKEQTDSIIGGLIKSSLREEWKVSPLALQLLFAADRAHHMASEILPALEKGKIVICDRYILSTLAFGSLDVDMTYLKQINEKFPEPNITLIIDVPVDECLSRIRQSREGRELFEEREKLEKVRKNYMALENHFMNTHIVDGSGSKDDVAERIRRIVDRMM